MTSNPAIHLVAAARPNFMKVAPLYHELANQGWCQPVLVHTGQHYDARMSQTFFTDLGLPDPTINLDVGSGSHAEQTGRVLIAYEAYCLSSHPDLCVVVGDVNSTMACALAAVKIGTPVAHLEAGLRSFDRRMPEEINRIVTDSISDLLLTPSRDADENLKREGIPDSRIKFVGNIMIDSYELLKDRINGRRYPDTLHLKTKQYCVVTIHRPSNVDDGPTLARIVESIKSISDRITVVAPLHPRTQRKLAEFDFLNSLKSAKNVIVVDPLSYIDFMSLVTSSRFVQTDSGGVQEETSHLGIPCLTLRENTERPITTTKGTNRLISLENLQNSVEDALRGIWPEGSRIEYWDGRTAQRTAQALREFMTS